MIFKQFDEETITFCSDLSLLRPAIEPNIFHSSGKDYTTTPKHKCIYAMDFILNVLYPWCDVRNYMYIISSITLLQLYLKM